MERETIQSPQGEWVEIPPEELHFRFEPFTRQVARQRAARLLKGLKNHGFQSKKDDSELYGGDPTKIYGLIHVVNPQEFVTTRSEEYSKKEFQVQVIFEPLNQEIPIAVSHFNPNYIAESSNKSILWPTLLIEGNYVKGENEWYMVYVGTKKEGYEITLFTTVDLDSSPRTVESLPAEFTTFGLRYNLKENQKAKEILSEIGQRRVPADFMADTRSRTSQVNARQNEEGLDINLELFFQDPNPNSYLRCYEVEIFSQEGEKNVPNTRDIAPESIWQDDENHYCMIGENGTFPLVPVSLENARKFTLLVEYNGSNFRNVSPILEGMPLTLDYSNEWHAQAKVGKGVTDLFFKPEWGNAKLVYRQHSEKRITPRNISKAVEQMAKLKEKLT